MTISQKINMIIIITRYGSIRRTHIPPPAVSTTIKYLRTPYSRVFISKYFGCRLTLTFLFLFFLVQNIHFLNQIFSLDILNLKSPNKQHSPNLINLKALRFSLYFKNKIFSEGGGGRLMQISNWFVQLGKSAIPEI